MDILADEKDMQDFFGDNPITTSSVRVTKACNLKCKHCYADGGKKLEKELTLDEIKNIIDQLEEMGCMSIFYTGGEPFSRKDIVDVLKYTDKKKIGIYISSNGTLLTEDKLEQIKDLNFKEFQVSLDGPEEVHDTIRGKGSYKKAVEAIKKSKKIINKNITIGTVMMKYNYEHLVKTFDLANELGVDVFSMMLLITAGRASTSIDVPIKEKIETLHALFAKYKHLQKEIKFACNSTLPPALVPKELRDAGVHKQFACCSFPNTLGVECNGDVAPCDGFFNHPEWIAGNIRDKPLKEIWNNSKVFKEVKSIKLSEFKGVCKKCKYLEYCGGGCRAAAWNAYKDIRMPDPVCQMMYDAGFFPKDCLVE